MRLNTLALLGVVSVAWAQQTPDATTTTSAAPTSTEVSEDKADLGSASLGTGATIVTLSGGGKAVSVNLKPGEESTTGVSVKTTGQIKNGDESAVKADVGIGNSAKAKRAVSDCTLTILLNGQTVFSQKMETSDTFQHITSSPVPATADPNIEFKYACGNTPQPLLIANVGVATGPPGAVGNPNSPGSTPTNGSGSSTPTGSSAPTGTNGSGSATDSAAASAPGAATDSAVSTGPATGTGVATGTSTPTSSATPSFPHDAGDFKFFGCVGSADGFPSFNLSGETPDLDLKLCGTFCAGNKYFGVHKNQCFCGAKIDGTRTTKVPTEHCNNPCPGNEKESCGGDVGSTSPFRLARRRLSARQSISNTILLTVYEASSQSPVVTGTPTPATSMVTVTATGAGATSAVTVSTSINLQFFIFISFPGSSCKEGDLVYLPEACICKGGKSYVPHRCTATSCKDKEVFKAQECNAGEEEKQTVYSADVCKGNNCSSGIVYKPVENTPGETGSSNNTPNTPNSNSPASSASPATPDSSSSSSTTCTGSDCKSVTSLVPGIKTPVIASGAVGHAVSVFSMIAALAVALI